MRILPTLTNTLRSLLLDLVGLSDREVIKAHWPDNQSRLHDRNKDGSRVSFYCGKCRYYHAMPARLIASEALSRLPVRASGEFLLHREMAWRIMQTNLHPHVIS